MSSLVGTLNFLSDTRKYRHAKNLCSAIIADEELDERLNTPITQHIQSLEIVFKRNYLSLKNKKSHSHKTSFRLL